MIDLHCHLLPSIDDGSHDLDETLRLIDCAYNDGIRHIAFTPHIHPGRWENTKQSLEPLYKEIVSAISTSYNNLGMSLGGEIRFTSEILDLESKGEIPYLGHWDGDRVLLLEFPHSHLPAGFQNLVLWLRNRGIKPMIAHPERNKEIMRDYSKLNPLVDLECLFQVTAMSVTGDFGPAAHEVAHKMLESNLVTAVASDAHNLKSRPPILSKARQKIVDLYGEKLANQLLNDNPAKILSL